MVSVGYKLGKWFEDLHQAIMKRAAACEVDDERKSSKPRFNGPSFPFDNHLDQNPFDIFENGPNPAGFIRGKFFMVWRPSTSAQKFLAVVEVAPEPSLKYTDSRTVRFQVEFSGRCAKFFHVFADSISVATHFILSLEGAHLDKRSSSVGLPMTIGFPDGVKIKCTQSHKEVVIDTWMSTFFLPCLSIWINFVQISGKIRRSTRRKLVLDPLSDVGTAFFDQ
jgi:hypothetical protein